MIKLKGEKNSHAQQTMERAMGMRGPESGPAPIAKTLGLPSAKSQEEKYGWAASQNRINVGAPISIKGKTEPKVRDEEEDKSRDKDKDDDFDFSDEEDDDSVLAALREKRLEALKQQNSKQQLWQQMGHGSHTEIGQDEFLPSVTKSKYVVCHFYHPDFETCKILDMHLARLAQAHLPTRFLKINAEKAPFFVGKLQIRVLPTLIFFKDGIAIDRMVGFADVGGTNEFETSALEKRIAQSGVILSKENQKKKGDDDDEEEEDQRDKFIRASENRNKILID